MAIRPVDGATDRKFQWGHVVIDVETNEFAQRAGLTFKGFQWGHVVIDVETAMSVRCDDHQQGMLFQWGHVVIDVETRRRRLRRRDAEMEGFNGATS